MLDIVHDRILFIVRRCKKKNEKEKEKKTEMQYIKPRDKNILQVLSFSMKFHRGITNDDENRARLCTMTRYIDLSVFVLFSFRNCYLWTLTPDIERTKYI
jgi:hypothetical protein